MGEFLTCRRSAPTNIIVVINISKRRSPRAKNRKRLILSLEFSGVGPAMLGSTQRREGRSRQRVAARENMETGKRER